MLFPSPMSLLAGRSIYPVAASLATLYFTDTRIQLLQASDMDSALGLHQAFRGH